MHRSLLMLVGLVGLGVVVVGAPQGDQKTANLALGVPYTVRPAPNYSYCTDRGDKTQLTDGVYTQGYFWTQKSTVGWTRSGPVFITLDLGAVKPISGVSFNTAAGVAGVRWPASVLVFVSDDGKKWYRVADLVQLAPADFLPPEGTYAVRKFSTQSLKTHGRYVQLAIVPSGPYVFTDEIEVYGGPHEYLTEALPGKPVADVPATLHGLQVYQLAQSQIRRDLQVARASLEKGKLSAEERAVLAKEAQALEKAVNQMPPLPEKGFRALLPLNDVHRRVFELQASIWRAESKPLLRVWHCNRWDYLSPAAEPAENRGAPAVQVRMMRGEVRADVLNFTNAGSAPLTLRLRIAGLPGGSPPDYLTVREVLHVGTRAYKSVAAALPEARREGDEYVLTVPSGMTGQAWFEFHPRRLSPGRYEGQVLVRAKGLDRVTVPLRLTISPLTFPARTSLLLGGWSYTDRTSGWGVTQANHDAFVTYLKEHLVTAPWATSRTMPEGKFDAEGRLAEPPDTTAFDQWVRSWWGAGRYFVFLARGDSFAGAKMGTPAFERRLGNWAHFWAQHLRKLGLKPSQLGLLIHDEPREARGYSITVNWAKAIHAAEPDLRIFVDPIPRGPEGLDSVLEAVDMLCPNRVHWLTTDWLAPLYAKYLNQGKQLCFYSCSGPARAFDPFAYYLAQEWHCFKVGATASFFWSFGDTRGADAWNEYAGKNPGPYCPMYLAADSVTTAKWMEAIREGVEDYEYLVMLRDRLKALQGGERVRKSTLRRARKVLERGVDEVLAAADGAEFTWDKPRDRDVVDRVRARVLDALEALTAAQRTP